MRSIGNFYVITVVVLAIAGAACARDDLPAPLGDTTVAAAVAPDARTGQRARVFTNPVLPGDHPDMNLFVQGNDFYVTGSDFNMSPNVEILHSTDLVHWERVSRVVSPEWSGLQGSIAGGGTWGGFIVK